MEAAELLIRMGAGREQRPLDEQSLDLLFELERGIVSGDWFGRDRDSWAGEGARSETPNEGQMSGTVSATETSLATTSGNVASRCAPLRRARSASSLRSAPAAEPGNVSRLQEHVMLPFRYSINVTFDGCSRERAA